MPGILERAVVEPKRYVEKVQSFLYGRRKREPPPHKNALAILNETQRTCQNWIFDFDSCNRTRDMPHIEAAKPAILAAEAHGMLRPRIQQQPCVLDTAGGQYENACFHFKASFARSHHGSTDFSGFSDRKAHDVAPEMNPKPAGATEPVLVHNSNAWLAAPALELCNGNVTRHAIERRWRGKIRRPAVE